jgi:hypothetical protein
MAVSFQMVMKAAGERAKAAESATLELTLSMAVGVVTLSRLEGGMAALGTDLSTLCSTLVATSSVSSVIVTLTGLCAR